MALEFSASLPDADATRQFAGRLAALLRPGDLVVLTGDLGAGKTTFTQGLAAELEVQGRVASPTFIIAREHPGKRREDGTHGPALIHVDAYRLGSLEELDQLDLDSSLAEAITVVEWGRGLVERLVPSYLEVELIRERGLPTGANIAEQDPEAGTRQLILHPHGPRWADVDFEALR